MPEQTFNVPVGTWYRTCQECGFKQVDRKPDTNKELTDAYRDRKCKRCHSEALDYGTQWSDLNFIEE